MRTVKTTLPPEPSLAERLRVERFANQVAVEKFNRIMGKAKHQPGGVAAFARRINDYDPKGGE